MKRFIKSAVCIASMLSLLSPQTTAAAESKIPEKRVAKFNKSYFNKLQTQVVESTQKVEWRNLGPALSGYCDEFWIHPTDPDYMYTSMDMGNSYYTDNGAREEWISIMDWDDPKQQNRIGWIDFSHQNPKFGLALDDSGKLMQTTDQGRTFDYMNNAKGFPMRSGETKKSLIVVDPNNDNNWYIGAGQPWKVKFTHRSLKDIYGTKAGNVGTGYYLVSKDRGKSWREVRLAGYEDLAVLRIFINPANSKELFSFTNRGFFKSANGGLKWERVGKGLPYNTPRDGAMYYDAKSKKVILYLLEQTRFEGQGKTIASSGGVYRSDDKGENWVNITGDMALDFTKFGKAFHPQSQFYKAMGYWFGTTPDKVKKQYPELPKSLLSIYNRMVVNPLNPDEIFVMTNIKHDKTFGPVEMWKTKDGGKHWYSTLRSGTYWSKKEDAELWRERGANDPLGMNTRFAHLHNEMENHNMWAGTRYAGFNNKGEMFIVHEQQVLISTDSGETWRQIDDIEATPGNWVGKGCSNLPGQGIIVETGMKRILYRAGEHGLWISGDMGDCKYNGVAVHQLSGQSKTQYDAVSISTAAVNPRDTNQIFMLMFRQAKAGYLRASDDCGKTWYTVNEDKPVVPYKIGLGHIDQRRLTIDYNNPKNMYFTLPIVRYNNHAKTQWSPNTPDDFPKDWQGIYRTKDGGANWSMANNGLPQGASVWSITMDRKESKTLYACVTGKYNVADARKANKVVGGGLYRTTDGGDSWKKMAIPTEIECVNQLFIDINTNEFYLSAGQANGEPNAGGVWSSRDGGKSWKKIFEMPYVKNCNASNCNPNIIAVNVGKCNAIQRLNSGAYISLDGGSSWTKANYQMGLPERITNIIPDPRDESLIWLSNYGCGWYRGKILDKNL